MDRLDTETIAAIAGGIGGAISLVRVSGPRAFQLASAVWSGKNDLEGAPIRTVLHGAVVDSDGRSVDQCLAVLFRGPNSYTGEDLVEFHTHGGTLVPREVLRTLLDAGARHAEPGEFTKRAFINGKMDLTQAEAVGDLIGAHSSMAMHIANRQLVGSLGRKVDSIYSQLAGLLSEIESRLDFPEEDLAWLSPEELRQGLGAAEGQIRDLLRNRREGEVLREGVRLVIAGGPNVGKSSLLNAILGRDRAIVTDIPGTTRDTLEELAHVRGIPVRVTDTAGIRDSADLVERSGVDRSLESLRMAQVVLWVYDVCHPESRDAGRDLPISVSTITVANKIDLLGQGVTVPDGHIGVSALRGEGLEGLYDEIEKVVWDRPHSGEPECAVSVRHGQLLDSALAALDSVPERILSEEWELAAISLRTAVEEVGRIAGRTASYDVLDEIFSKFCIGK